ncbi:hypothetical protein BDZ91DRAFT_739535 [Kalaharituber pfeilii]|nr:hypothetical protein BDZ91DRAFT_739535 [Kalaharituber pfeilii]
MHLRRLDAVGTPVVSAAKSLCPLLCLLYLPILITVLIRKQDSTIGRTVSVVRQ